jgi:hypothetical protein
MQIFRLLVNCCLPHDIDVESVSRGSSAGRLTKDHEQILLQCSANPRTLEQYARLAFRDAIVRLGRVKGRLCYVEDAAGCSVARESFGASRFSSRSYYLDTCLLEDVVAELRLCKPLSDFMSFRVP